MNNEINLLGDLLCAYFRPLEDYMTGDSIYDDTGLLNQPLWHYRMQSISLTNILGKLKIFQGLNQDFSGDISHFLGQLVSVT